MVDRLQGQVLHLARLQGQFGRAAHRPFDAVAVSVHVEEAHERQLVQVAEAVEQAAAQLHEGAPAATADSDDDGRPQRPGLRQGLGQAQLRNVGELGLRRRRRRAQVHRHHVVFARPPFQGNVFHRVEQGERPLAGQLFGQHDFTGRLQPGAVQRPHESQAVGEAFGRVLGQRAGDDGPFRLGKRAQLRRLVHVLLGQGAGVLAVEGPLAGQQFLVDDR